MLPTTLPLDTNTICTFPLHQLVEHGLGLLQIQRIKALGEHLLETRRTRGFSANPWSVGSRFIVSHSVLSDETYMRDLRDILSPFRSGSMFILDEAHMRRPRPGLPGPSKAR